MTWPCYVYLWAYSHDRCRT